MTTQSEQFKIFDNWLQMASIPAHYCRDTLAACALANAYDVPLAKLADVAIDTACLYCDDESMAREAGIIP